MCRLLLALFVFNYSPSYIWAHIVSLPRCSVDAALIWAGGHQGRLEFSCFNALITTGLIYFLLNVVIRPLRVLNDRIIFLRSEGIQIRVQDFFTRFGATRDIICWFGSFPGLGYVVDVHSILLLAISANCYFVGCAILGAWVFQVIVSGHCWCLRRYTLGFFLICAICLHFWAPAGFEGFHFDLAGSGFLFQWRLHI